MNVPKPTGSKSVSKSSRAIKDELKAFKKKVKSKVKTLKKKIQSVKVPAAATTTTPATKITPTIPKTTPEVLKQTPTTKPATSPAVVGDESDLLIEKTYRVDGYNYASDTYEYNNGERPPPSDASPGVPSDSYSDYSMF